MTYSEKYKILTDLYFNKGDKSALDKMLQMARGAFFREANKHSIEPDIKEEFAQDAMVQILEAVEDFDFEKSDNFSGIVGTIITRKMHAMRFNVAHPNVPAHARKKLTKSKLFAESDYGKKDVKVGTVTHSAESIAAANAFLNVRVVSTEKKMTEDGDTLGSILPSEALQVDEVMEGDESNNALVHVISLLSDKEQKMIKDHFGDGITYTDIAKSDGVSPQAVHLRYLKVLKKVNVALTERGENYVDMRECINQAKLF